MNVSKTRANSGNGLMAVSYPYVHVAWTDSGKPLYSRSNNGMTFGTGVQIFSNSATTAILDMAASGQNVYVARSSSASQNKPGQVYVRSSTDYGASFNAEVQVSGASSSPGATLWGIAAAGNTVHVVWAQWTGHWQVFYARSVSGGSFGTPLQLSATAGNDTLASANVVADGTNVHIAWTDYRDDGTRAIYYIGSTDGGANFGGLIEVSDSSNPLTTTNVFPYLAASGADVYLVWKAHASDDLTPYMYFARSIDAGGSFSYPAKVPGTGSEVQGLAVSGDDVHVIWQVNSDIFYTRSHDKGVTWSAAATNISYPSFGALDGSPMPVIAANASDVYIAWKGGASPAFEIYMRHSGNGGDSFLGVVNVSQTPSANSAYPSTIATPGKVHVLWEDSSPGNSDIFYRQGTP